MLCFAILGCLTLNIYRGAIMSFLLVSDIYRGFTASQTISVAGKGKKQCIKNIFKHF